MSDIHIKTKKIIMPNMMIDAILNEKKNQFRELILPQPTHRLVEPKVGLTVKMDPAEDGAVWYDSDGVNPGREVRCHLGRPLDRLWVTSPEKNDTKQVTLEIVSIRGQRIRDISEKDALEEGVEPISCEPASIVFNTWKAQFRYRDAFRAFWNQLHSDPSHQFEANPWVWAITFRKHSIGWN